RQTADARRGPVPLDDGREMTPGEMTALAREARRAIREEDLHLRDASWVHQYLAGCRVAGVVLGLHREPLLAHRYPGRFATPSAVDQLALNRKEPADRSARLRRGALLESRGEDERADGGP